ncbi:hypothetical protein B0H66DRAFT_537524 [Apodospora peruviana]|uniref:Uncharacterized protein n=1 Tax=Apodospora peruviana TaxID=516989 RepID=A0AAE0HX93_9PEZI|nr:hypothetical protein B0H66DRAFT_537524 [Apodospora peruviana]
MSANSATPATASNQASSNRTTVKHNVRRPKTINNIRCQRRGPAKQASATPDNASVAAKKAPAAATPALTTTEDIFPALPPVSKVSAGIEPTGPRFKDLAAARVWATVSKKDVAMKKDDPASATTGQTGQSGIFPRPKVPLGTEAVTSPTGPKKKVAVPDVNPAKSRGFGPPPKDTFHKSFEYLVKEKVARGELNQLPRQQVKYVFESITEYTRDENYRIYNPSEEALQELSNRTLPLECSSSNFGAVHNKLKSESAIERAIAKKITKGTFGVD